jgi:hypothetical protein
MHPPFQNPEVAAIFAAYPPALQIKLLQMRQLIFEVAASTKRVGELEEALRWGQPSYLTTASKSGSTIRLDAIKEEAGHYALYFNCKTTLVDTFRAIYRDQFTYEGNRAIIFQVEDEIPMAALKHCISLALTYHLTKK